MASTEHAPKRVALPETKHSAWTNNYIVALWFALLTILASTPAYYMIYTGFSYWDDEGALMVTVKQYLGGMKLYNQISVPYGPVYYFYNWALRTLSATPVTHDVVRMSSLLPWLLTALVSAWIVFRLTDSLALASLAHFLVFFELSSFFHNEPGHPQELCILLLVCLVGAAVMVSIPQWRLQGSILLGALASAIALIKVNLGAFVFLATSLAILAHSRKTRLSRLAFNAVAATSVLFPAILMKAHLGVPATRMFAVVVTASTAAVLLIVLRSPRTCNVRLHDVVAVSLAFVCTFIVTIFILKIQGVALTRVVHALLLDSLGPYIIHGSWHVPIPIPFGRRWYFWIIGGLVAADFFSRSSWEPQRKENYIATSKILLFLLMVFVLVLKVSPYGLFPPFFILACPFCWLVLYQHSDDDKADPFPRTLLCTVAVLQTLYAYPVAGSQFAFAQVLLIVVVVICFNDSLVWLQKRFHTLSTPIRSAASTALLLCVAASYVGIAATARNEYYSLSSLQLPGSSRIHLAETQAQDYRWLVRHLNDYCDVFVGLPELPSLHIWTGKDPLDGMDMDDWMITTSSEQQGAAVAILAAHRESCAVYNPDLVEFWDRPHRDISALPLVRYLHDNFRVLGSTGQFSLLVRKDRNLTLSSTQ